MQSGYLILNYFPTGGRKRGFGTYRLGRAGNRNQKFPSDSELNELFAKISSNGFEVYSRGINNCILFIQAGTSAVVREKFLTAVSEHIK